MGGGGAGGSKNRSLGRTSAASSVGFSINILSNIFVQNILSQVWTKIKMEANNCKKKRQLSSGKYNAYFNITSTVDSVQMYFELKCENQINYT